MCVAIGLNASAFSLYLVARQLILSLLKQSQPINDPCIQGILNWSQNKILLDSQCFGYFVTRLRRNEVGSAMAALCHDLAVGPWGWGGWAVTDNEPWKTWFILSIFSPVSIFSSVVWFHFALPPSGWWTLLEMSSLAAGVKESQDRSKSLHLRWVIGYDFLAKDLVEWKSWIPNLVAVPLL